MNSVLAPILIQLLDLTKYPFTVWELLVLMFLSAALVISHLPQTSQNMKPDSAKENKNIRPCLGPLGFQVRIRTEDKASSKCAHWRQKQRDKRREQRAESREAKNLLNFGEVVSHGEEFFFFYSDVVLTDHVQYMQL